MGDTFERHLSERRMQAYFQSLDIKASDAWTLFKLLDESNDHVIDLDQFIEGCLHLKGPATAIDLKSLATEFHWFAEHMDRKFLQVETKQEKLELHLHHRKSDVNNIEHIKDRISDRRSERSIFRDSVCTVETDVIPGFTTHELS